jgi:hypothetical protein
MQQGCASYRRLLSRRSFFQVGGAGLFGLTWPDLFRAEARTSGARKAKQAIFIFLQGGPPQSDTFDMKPDRPEEVRGPFQPIKTVVPGLEVCEHLPRLAKAANRFSVLRSVNARGYPQAGDHHGGNTWKTGNPRGMRGTPKYPMFGSVVAKLCPTPRDLPAFTALGEIDTNAPGLKENYLGPAYDPLSLNVDARRDGTPDPLTKMLVPSTRDVPDFERNVELLRALEEQNRRQDGADEVIGSLDQFQQKAFDLLRSPRLRQALELEKEPAKNLERYGVSLLHYGKVNFTRRVLAARRLIEAGVPFVYVDLPYWDWHNGGGLEMPLANLAALDAALSSLLEDLAERGLLETTAIVATGEMGRTPKVGSQKGKYGREHWAPSQIVLVAGGGFQPGVVVGATDRDAAYVKDREYKVTSLGKTLYHVLGLDPDHELVTPDNRPIKLIVEDVPLIKEVLA